MTGRAVGPRRRVVPAGDDGAAAVLTAILVAVLVGMAALAVDLGNLYARAARADATAEEAALAAASALGASDPCQTLVAAAMSLNANPVPDDVAQDPATAAQLRDGDPANGEVELLDADGAPVAAAAPCTGRATQVSVTTPQAGVEFGFAAIFGFSGTTVTSTATVQLRSPLPTLPLALPEECAGPGPHTLVLDPQPPPVPPVVRPTLPPADPPGVRPALLLTVGAVLDAASQPPVVRVAVAGREVDSRWWVEFRAVVDGTAVRVVVDPDTATPRGQTLAAVPGSGGDTVTVALPAEVLAAPGPWSVRAGREAQVGELPRETLASGVVVWSAVATPLDVPAGPVVPQPVAGQVPLCDASGVYGDLLRTGPGLAPLTDPPSVGATVTALDLATWVADEANAEADVSALLTRPGAPPVPWGDPGIVLDPRVFLVPVVRLQGTTFVVTGYVAAVVTDEQTLDPAAPLPVCTLSGCPGVTRAGGRIASVRVLTSDPLDLPAGTIRLPGNGYPWRGGPADRQVTG